MGTMVGAWVFAVLLAGSGGTAQAADACPNAAYRSGAGANLADCRAWEQATPIDKTGNVPDDSRTTVAGTSGALFTASGAIGDVDSVPYIGLYAANRSSTWSTQAMDPPLNPSSIIATKASAGISDDLARVLMATQRALTPGAVDGQSNVYLRSTADRRDFTLLASVPGTSLFADFLDPIGPSFLAGSARLDHVALRSTSSLAGGAPTGVLNVYDVSGGQVRLASVLPGGAPMPMGTNLTGLTPLRQRRLVSTDGSRFTIGTDNADRSSSFLYQRVGGTETTLISHNATGDTTTPRSGRDPWASDDGTRVTFLSDDALTAQSGTAGPRPYEWNAAGDTITDLFDGVVAAGTPTGITSLNRVSPDRDSVWFTSTAVLAAGAQAGVPNQYLLDVPGKRISRVATGVGDPSDLFSNFQWSPDGKRLAITTEVPLTGRAVGNDTCDGGPCRQIYSFDAAQPGAGPTCVSCDPDSDRATSNAANGPADNQFGGLVQHSITDDGRVYFDTADPLVDADVNTLRDVYEYRPGRGLALISSGTGETAARFGDATADGNDVYFYTAQPLVPQDADRVTDLYDARVGGGLAAQQSSPPTAGGSCQGGDCQGTPTTPPARPRPGVSPFAPSVRPPAFTVGHVSAAARRAAASSGRLTIRVKVGAAGRVAATLRGRIGSHTRTAARASRGVRRAGTVALSLRLSASARRQLAREGRLRLALTVSYSRVGDRHTGVIPLQRRTASNEKGGAR